MTKRKMAAGSAGETVAAIATAAGQAGIAIVRVSGPDGLSIADRLFRCAGAPPSERPGGSFVHGFVRSPENGEDIDEAVLLVYRQPRSYTREDVVEFQCHGGRVSAARVLAAAIDAGARIAEAGEFTRRAFLSGRIDLAQAEAVADLIRARSDRAAVAAMEQLEGHLSDEIRACYDVLIDAAADVESALDFEDDGIAEDAVADVGRRIRLVRERLEALLRTWREGRVLREGALVVISGRPNAGKSTLLNCLLGAERAIVAEEPGTTRDTIEEQLIIDGTPLRLVDTAGLRETECRIEQAGVERAHGTTGMADLVLYVVDASVPLDEVDIKYVERHGRDRCVVVLNKTDLGARIAEEQFSGGAVVPCSLLHGEGIDGVRNAMVSGVGVPGGDAAHAAISERHRQCVQDALNTLNSVDDATILAQDRIALVAADLREAIEALGRITGRTYTDDLLDRVFSRFCVGK